MLQPQLLSPERLADLERNYCSDATPMARLCSDMMAHIKAQSHMIDSAHKDPGLMASEPGIIQPMKDSNLFEFVPTHRVPPDESSKPADQAAGTQPIKRGPGRPRKNSVESNVG